ncbi:MAG: MarR family transcriptional regulator [Firmicutes bacterium HGW-Firmicutes-1]|jgi:DNA-binding MarR family transcriptional regulator|nr:MAG: MarR family transcriptional regulator [Firmicutes bacterium HGW-Firmicutes-1]
MSIDSDSIPTSYVELGRHISILYRYGRIFMDQKMADFTIGSGQYSFIFFLSNHNGASQEEISTALCMDKTTTTRAIQKLETSGFIRRQKDIDDQRMNRVFLTESGQEIYKILKEYSYEWQEILLHNLTLKEVSQLESLMNKLTGNARYNRNLMNRKGDENVK